MGVPMLNRRRFLTIGAIVAGGAVAVPAGAMSLSASTDNATKMRDMLVPNEGTGHVAALPAGLAFPVLMPIPPVLLKAAFDPVRDIYQLNVTAADVELLPGLSTP